MKNYINKIKVSKKSVNEMYDKKIKVGYCALQDLLGRFYYPRFYTAGAYGWNSDVYDICVEGVGYVAIVTGYNTFGNLEASSDICEKYNNLGKRLDWKECNEADKLLNNFIKEVIANNETVTSVQA